MLDKPPLRMRAEPCEQRAALLKRYRECTTAYTALVKQLEETVESDCDFIQKRIDLAKQQMSATLNDLDIHVSRHRCLNR